MALANAFEKIGTAMGGLWERVQELAHVKASPLGCTSSQAPEVQGSGGSISPDIGAGTLESLSGEFPHVVRTWKAFQSARVSGDGRIRLRGRDTLDICVTIGRVQEAINLFSQLIRHIDNAGVPIETRMADGWRNCAIVGNIPVSIRIRERLHRVQKADRFSVALEKLLGGRLPDKLLPSGKLHVQIMRFGVAVESFEVKNSIPEALLERIEKSIRRAAEREEVHQRRMLAAAMSRSHARHVIVPPASRIPMATVAPRPASMRELMDALDRLVAEYRGLGGDREPVAGAMSESMLNLSKAIHVCKDVPETRMMTASKGTGQVKRNRRVRCVA